MMKKLSFLLTLLFGLAYGSAEAQNCYALYQYFPTTGYTIQFADSSGTNAGNINSYAWDFGDGNTSSSIIPLHTYSNQGTYVVCLTITTTLGCTATYCDSIVVGSATNPPCNSYYYYNTDTLNNAYFTGTVTGGTAPFTYLWDFGDGGSSTSSTPVHNYNSPGAYGVTFNVTDANGITCMYYDTVYVNYCNAFFIATTQPNSGTVNFTNYSANPQYGVDYWWNFGDGSPNLYQKHATHTYAASGTYVVTLNSYDSLNNCFSSYTDSVAINLGNPPASCSASYYVALDSSAAFKVILYNTSSNAPSHTYFWDFGDGITGSGRIPQHQYQNFGTYVVCLTITDNQLNCTSTFCDTVGMDSLGNLKAAGFGLEVRNPLAVGVQEEIGLENLSVYPNPAVNQISVDLRNVSESIEVRILDISGKEVISRLRTNTGTIEQIDISKLNSGFYFMVLNDGENQRIEKIVVNK